MNTVGELWMRYYEETKGNHNCDYGDYDNSDEDDDDNDDGDEYE